MCAKRSIWPKGELPEDTDDPLINEVNFSLFPVLVVTLSGDIPERALFRIARDLQDRIEACPMCWASMAGTGKNCWRS